MPRRCVVGGCSNDSFPAHTWPKDPGQAVAWKRFVDRSRSDKYAISQKTSICCLHFGLEVFSNFMPWKMGFGYLQLSPGAVPTFINCLENPDKDAFVAVVATREGQEPQIKQAVAMASRKRKVEGTLEPTKAQRKLETVRMHEEHRVAERKRVEIQVEAERVAMLPREESTQTTDVQTTDGSMQHDPDTVDKRTQVHVIGNAKSTQYKAFVQTKGTTTGGLVLTRSVGSSVSMFEEEEENRRQQEEERRQQAEDETTQKQEDPDYLPPSYLTVKSTSMSTPDEEVILVQKSRLLQVLAVCTFCASKATVTEEKCSGTFFSAAMECEECNRIWKWQNQDVVRSMPILNLIMSAVMYMTGSTITKTLRVFQFMRIRHISASTFYYHAQKYVMPHIMSVWSHQQAQLLTGIRQAGRRLTLLGDGRSDSPGHSAKYGTYSLLDADTGKVLASHVVQSNEVGGSYHCELEGLRRALQQVGVGSIHKLVTDRHRQIAKWLRENAPTILHCFDVWHVAKGISKKLIALGKQPECGIISRWRPSIINHLYWCARTTQENNGDLILSKWLSMLDHMGDIHEGFDGPYEQCEHENLDQRDIEWIEPGTKASVKIEDLVSKKMLQNDIRKLSTTAQTSSLESFHSLMLTFTPKHTAFSFNGMKARTALAAMHWNSNADRAQAQTQNGELRFSLSFPKAKMGQPTVKKIMEAANYGYVLDLLYTLVTVYTEDHHQFRALQDDVREAPAPLAQDHDREQTKEELVAAFFTRFAR